MSATLEQIKRQYAGFVCTSSVVEHIYKASADLEHIALSLVHGGIEPENGFGGCSCSTCATLREKITAIRAEEAELAFAAKYGLPPDEN